MPSYRKDHFGHLDLAGGNAGGNLLQDLGVVVEPLKAQAQRVHEGLACIRGVESPDRADALIGAVMMGPGSDPYVLNPRGRQAFLEVMQEVTRLALEDPWRVDRIVF